MKTPRPHVKRAPNQPARPPVDMRAAMLRGALDRVDPDGTVEGWCWSAQEPFRRRWVAVLVDQTEALRLLCDSPRPDLQEAGIGDGSHAFRATLSPRITVSGQSSAVELRDVATGLVVGGRVQVVWEAPTVAPLSDRPRLAGNIDRVTRDGWVAGWCWYPDHPERRAELDILIDGQVVGTVTAAAFRPDLKDAGIGDGEHGFAFAIPYGALEGRCAVTVAVQESGGGQPVAEPMTLRIGAAVGAVERVQELERQIRLLQDELNRLQRYLLERAEEKATRALFGTVAAFFAELARGGLAAGSALDATGIHAAFGELGARLPRLEFARPDAPEATIVVAATAGPEIVYGCLSALHDAGLDERADIVLVDDGAASPRNALLPALVSNLGYHRAATGMSLVEARTESLRTARTDLLVFLAPELRLQPGWLDAIIDALARSPEAVLVGGCVRRADGRIQHAFLSRGHDDRSLYDAGWLAGGDDPAFRFLREVDAVAGYGFAVRATAFRGAGGFAPLYCRFGHGTAELCARLRSAGRALVYQPFAEALLTEEGSATLDAAPPDLTLTDEETLRLREQLRPLWAGVSACRPAGHALVIDDRVPRPDCDGGSEAALAQMRLLLDMGWCVTFMSMDAAESAGPAADGLRRMGVSVVGPPAVTSVTAYLQEMGSHLDLVHVHRYTNAALLAERIRASAPQAKLLLSVADLHHLRAQREAALFGQSTALVERMRDAELAAVAAADMTVVHSDHEAGLLASVVAPERVTLLRWIARPSPATRTFSERRDIGFVGSFDHAPNLDGATWFVDEVLPELRGRLPQLRLHLAGSATPRSIRALASDSVIVRGWTPDLAGYFGGLRASIAPLRYGAGFKAKVAASLAHGLPVVGTPIAFEGTGLTEVDGIFVARTPSDFVNTLTALYEDEGTWRSASSAAISAVQRLYSPEFGADVWRKMLARMNSGVPVNAIAPAALQRKAAGKRAN